MTWQSKVSGQLQSISSHAVNSTKISLGLLKSWGFVFLKSLPQFSNWKLLPQSFLENLDQFRPPRAFAADTFLVATKMTESSTAHMDTTQQDTFYPFCCITDVHCVQNIPKYYNSITPSAQYVFNSHWSEHALTSRVFFEIIFPTFSSHLLPSGNSMSCNNTKKFSVF